MRSFYFLIIAVLLISCKNEAIKTAVPNPEPQIGLITERAMVVSAREEASQIGSDIMEKGGNAFDAMVATEMALALTYPTAGNLGGGGFIVYRTQSGEIGSFDFREKAPLQATQDMYLDTEGAFIKEKSKVGGLAVGVPGTIAGIFAVHQKLGTLSIEEILEPVIDLAQRGYVVTEKQAKRLKKYKATFEEVNKETSLYTRDYKGGDTIKNIALANTLTRISQQGR